MADTPKTVYLTPEELGRLLNVSSRTIHRAAESGNLEGWKAVTVGQRLRFVPASPLAQSTGEAIAAERPAQPIQMAPQPTQTAVGRSHAHDYQDTTREATPRYSPDEMKAALGDLVTELIDMAMEHRANRLATEQRAGRIGSVRR